MGDAGCDIQEAGALLTELHQDHSGIARMKAVARSVVARLGQRFRNFSQVMRSVSIGQTGPTCGPSTPVGVVHQNLGGLYVDFAGPFLSRMFFIVIDAHSKWPEVFEMVETTSAMTVAVLRHLFCFLWTTSTAGL